MFTDHFGADCSADGSFVFIIFLLSSSSFSILAFNMNVLMCKKYKPCYPTLLNIHYLTITFV